MKNYCVIGDPISHSLSPAIHNSLFRRYDMADCVYNRERVDIPDLPEFISSIQDRKIYGFNVTMPLKKAVLAFLSSTDPSATDGANTVVVTPDGLEGWSTDADGFRQSLALHGRDYKGAIVVFIGCGGAAQALIRDALEKGAKSVSILNRTPAKAEIFASDARVKIGSPKDVARFMPECDILVNATPLGMHGVKRNFEDLSFFDALPSRAMVADLIYNPPETDFLRAARETGHDTMNGLWMLIWQAFFAFEHFTGILPDIEDFRAIRAELGSA